MKFLRRFWKRISNFVARRNGAGRLREEIQEHLALETEANIRAGMKPEEARRKAVLQFGSVEAVREGYSSEKGLPLVETILQDCTYAIRMLRKSPAFTVVAILTLALGIGANASIFSLIHALLLKNLPVADPKTLLRLGNSNDCCVGMGSHDSGEHSLFSTNTYEYLRKNLPEFEDLAGIQAGWTYRQVVVRREGSEDPPRSVMGEFVSGNYFNTFGVAAVAGRTLVDSDDVAGAPLAAVMSYETWKTRFHGDASIVGGTIRVNTHPVTVVGIAPRGFYGDRLWNAPPEFYFPIETMVPIANVTYVHGTEAQWLYMVGRVRPGVSRAQLQQKVNTLLQQQLATTPRYRSEEGKLKLKNQHVVLTPGGAGIQAMQEQNDRQLRLLMAASGLLLLIACANLANLLLVRGMARKAEMNVRAALGARRGRIVRQLLTESVLLAGAGGLAGLAVAYAGTSMLLAMAFPGSVNDPISADPSTAVLAFACGLSLVTGVLFGVAPAWIASKSEPADALRGARTIAGGATVLQRTLVVLQAALSLVLLVGAGLFAKSLNKLEHIDLKLDPVNRYIVHINPQSAGYVQHEVGDLYRTIEERFHALPGVEKVGISSYTPMEDNNNGWNVVVQGKPDPNLIASYVKANAEYFDSVGTRVVMGRGITAQDTANSTGIAVVNKEFVRRLFKPGENPIGQHFGGSPKTAADWEIVGVVEDTAYESATFKDHMMYFVPLMQREKSADYPIDKDENMYAGAIVLKTSRPVDDMETLARRTLASINPNLSVVKFQSFDAQIAERFSQARMLSRLTMLFGGLALLLSTLGLYGVTAYAVARRTSEIGIRMALGARRATVTAMVVRGALVQALIGLGIGLGVAMLCVRGIESQLYEIKGVDPGVLTGAVLMLIAAALLAGLIPARRAASIEPARALRAE
ncbi:ABC transporter permease [Occallatibacter riparius]|uniref:ABC transporter permease n=1 Tax=Occallatibacter riparius TaxID=1002689 RepID=A0A9J7BH75_9BACT|nr:ABC transporter permease [Occallatibacter riparius]UWZ82324.1 ABC transporter permease [Occallatibacter riparius]